VASRQVCIVKRRANETEAAACVRAAWIALCLECGPWALVHDEESRRRVLERNP
jgi:hypothetical protein